MPGLGARFVAEFERCVGLLIDAPKIGTPYGRLRRFVIDDGFRFSIVYVVRAETLFVVAVAHNSRRAGYWRGRRVAR